MKLEQIMVLEDVKEFEGLDDKNVELWMTAVEQKALLDSVYEPVEDSIKGLVGYNAENIPDETATDRFKFGDVTVKVNTKPTTRMAYGAAVQRFRAYVEDRLTEREFGRSLPGVRLEENGAFLEINLMRFMLDRYVDGNTTKTVEQRIEYFDVLRPCERRTIDLDEREDLLGNEAVSNAMLAKKQVEKINDKILKRCRGKMQELLRHENPDSKVVLRKRFGDWVFTATAVPTCSVSYKSVIDGINAYFEKAEAGEFYGITRDGKGYMAADCVLGVVDKLIELNTERKLRWDIKPLKKPKNEAILSKEG